MLTHIKNLFAGLDKQQLAIVVAVQFVTIIGAVALAFYFKSKNRRTARARI